MSDFTQITTLVTAAQATAPAGPYDLTDLATVLDELNLSSGPGDRFLQRALTQVSAAFAKYCNRVFVVETVLDSFWPARSGFPRVVRGDVERLQLVRWPIVSVVSVTEDSVPLVAGTDFVPDMAKGQLIRLDCNGLPRFWRACSIAAQYAAGFPVIPDDLVMAALSAIKSAYFGRLRDRFLRSESVPGVGEASYWVASGKDAGAFTPDVQEILDTYRVPVIG